MRANPSRRELEILEAALELEREKGCAPPVGEVMAKIGAGRGTFYAALARLKERGFIDQPGEGWPLVVLRAPGGEAVTRSGPVLKETPQTESQSP